jgi:hypothetical protein
VAVVERLEANEPRIVAEVIDGEVVAINLERGCYYSMQGSAAVMWDCLAAGRSVDETVTELAARFDASQSELMAETSRLRRGLIDEDLLRPRASNAELPVLEQPTGIDLLPFEQPELEKFTDMEDLLLLDPIHDVDTQGWPKVQPATE